MVIIMVSSVVRRYSGGRTVATQSSSSATCAASCLPGGEFMSTYGADVNCHLACAPPPPPPPPLPPPSPPPPPPSPSVWPEAGDDIKPNYAGMYVPSGHSNAGYGGVVGLRALNVVWGRGGGGAGV
jgi:hypothetical protein